MKKIIIVLAILTAGIGVFFYGAQKLFYNYFTAGSLKIKAQAGLLDSQIVTEKDLKGLPEPVVRYMKFTGVVGKKKISFVRLKHSGTFKTGPDKPFMPIKGEYYVTTKKPSFSWYGILTMAPGLTAAAYDSYFDGRGRMLVKVMSIFNIADAQGEKTAKSAFGRCVAEMSMAPTLFLNRDFIKWEKVGKNSAEFIMNDGKYSAEAKITVNDDGSPSSFTVMRYYGEDDKTATLEKFTGKASEYREYSGYVLPSKFDGYWNLKSGDLHYVSFDVDSVEIE